VRRALRSASSGALEPREGLPEVRRRLARDEHPLAAFGMAKAERAGVQHLAGRVDRGSGEVFRPVNGVPDDRVADRRQMDADLMRPPRLEPEREERRSRHPADDAVVRHGAPPPLAARRRAAAAVARVPDEIEPDRAGIAGDASLDDRDVFPLDVVPAEELLEGAERLARPREDDRSGRLLVEAVDDADVRAAPVTVLQIGVHAREERVLLVGLGRQGQEPGGLVDDDQRRVLVEDDELRPDVPDGGPVDVEHDAGAVGDVAARLPADGAVDVDAPRLDVVARLAPRESVVARDALIEAHAAIV